MNSLTIIKSNGQFAIDSREVAEMTEVRHSDLLEKINGYVTHLLNGKFRSVEFFIKSSYEDSTGRTLPCYLLTRKGCDMVANKMTGEKGVLFTAAYVTKFEEMEKAQQKPVTALEALAQTVQALQEQERRMTQIETTQQAIKDAVISEPDNWREDIQRKLNKIAQAIGVNQYQEVRSESYKLLEQRAGVKLERRLDNKKARMLKEGAGQAAIKNTRKIDVIDEDKKLREIYGKIVSEYFIKYVA
jgi:Rha family phage regulatory protein